MKSDLIYLNHILECIDWISKFTEQGKDAFFADRKTQSAVLRELQTLAESSQRLSEQVKLAHPEVPWRHIAGLRNVLTHDYLGIRLERIWDIVINDLPPLRDSIQNIRAEIVRK